MVKNISDDGGYALASVLFLVTVLSILCAIILKVELDERKAILNTADKIKSQNASENGIVLAMSSLRSQSSSDSISSTQFGDGSSVEIEVFPWGLFTGVTSKGVSHSSACVRSALLGSSITDSERAALILGNLQHGLVFAGSSTIIGDVAVGPMGVSTGSLKDFSTPRSVPITGKKIVLSTPQLFFDTLALYRHVTLTRALFNHVRRSQGGQDNTGNAMECHGSLSLNQVDDSINYVFCDGSLSLRDTIMRRGPPLYIVVLGAVSLCENTLLSGPIFVSSTDSIVLPPKVSITNCVFTSTKSITLLSGSRMIAQLFSPRIHFSSGAAASYPSVAASTSFVDTSGSFQNIQFDDGSRIEGAVIMQRAGSIEMDRAVITLSPGATVMGGVYCDSYLTLDGTVDGYVRTFDLYFYDSPTAYLGWMRQGTINRTLLPFGSLKPVGVSGNDTLKVLSWM